MAPRNMSNTINLAVLSALACYGETSWPNPAVLSKSAASTNAAPSMKSSRIACPRSAALTT